MAENIWINGLLVIGTILTVTLTYLVYKRTQRDSERPVIEEIINDFIRPAIILLGRNITNCDSFDFPESLELNFGISISGQAYDRFSRRKRILKWRISRYNNSCNSINSRISSLTADAISVHIVHNIRTSGQRQIVLMDQYENHTTEQLNELLDQNNLLTSIRDIEQLQGRLPNKANKLITKLQKLLDKWREKYNIV